MDPGGDRVNTDREASPRRRVLGTSISGALAAPTPNYRQVATDTTAIETDDQLIDLVAIERAVNGGDAGNLTTTEKTYAVRVMRERGMSASAVAARMGVDERTVARWTAGQTPTGRVLAPCGTKQARQRHRKRGEPLCELCAVNAQPVRAVTA